MVDVTALVALVVAGVALVVAAGQLTQQLMATAYVIRKCDRIVTGSLTRGGGRQWHWRQFRFTVKYQAIIFALPPSVYSTLGINPTIKVDVAKPSQDLWLRAIQLRPNRTAMQACWITFVQDLIKCACILPDGVDVREESGDRIPDDLTVAPARVDALTVMLVCIAMGMQVYKFSPTTGEITLSGGLGSISTSSHPVLGTLLHYSVFLSEPQDGFEAVRRHGEALCGRDGVWPNAVFGRFRDRSHLPEFKPLGTLSARKLASLRASNWKDADYGDTIGGAACFLVFAQVDCYMAVPPSVVRPWCAHFAEFIVKAHHLNIYYNGRPAISLTPGYVRKLDLCAKRLCWSSPHLPWESLLDHPNSEEDELLSHIESDHALTSETLVQNLEGYTAVPVRKTEIGRTTSFLPIQSEAPTMTIQDSCPHEHLGVFHKIDPSSYTSTAAAWEVICRADRCMHFIHSSQLQLIRLQDLIDLVDKIIATAGSSLSAIGPPSWGNAGDKFRGWPQTFHDACSSVLRGHLASSKAKWISLYARFSILRAAYYTIMMRAAGEVGPGLAQDSRIDTALAYMA